MYNRVKFGRSALKGVRINRSEPPKLGAGAPPPCGGDMADPGNTPLPTCYPAEFGRSRSNDTRLMKIALKTDPSRPAFQDDSRSSEPTLIDRPPVTSCERSIATRGLSCTVSEINGDSSRKLCVFNAPWSPFELGNGAWAQETRMMVLPGEERIYTTTLDRRTLADSKYYAYA